MQSSQHHSLRIDIALNRSFILPFRGKVRGNFQIWKKKKKGIRGFGAEVGGNPTASSAKLLQVRIVRIQIGVLSSTVIEVERERKRGNEKRRFQVKVAVVVG